MIPLTSFLSNPLKEFQCVYHSLPKFKVLGPTDYCKRLYNTLKVNVVTLHSRFQLLFNVYFSGLLSLSH